MSKFKKILIFIIIVLVGIQFIPTKRNESMVILKTDFTKIYVVPENIQIILKNSCFDCHSNNTNYPWYNKIQPINWMMESHINNGKKELNFSEFGSYSKRKQKSKLKAIINQIKDDEMPLSSYTLIHRDARLSVKEKKIIKNWMGQLMNNIE
ncbi:MAG: heme-binding domain-containing protein [Lutibacter sp.]|jgi:hypothetical protein|uniref:heme-binding domain-containing protein n=1 Tax=Lutibacter sp. TaxID=1925666 RepID=UPI00299F1081|nr:heme-binding domain-containing protein [Lutibacter sp.]MDX1828860.1 heme-binding domain-containing protein [Lutibacter sp.]